MRHQGAARHFIAAVLEWLDRDGAARSRVIGPDAGPRLSRSRGLSFSSPRLFAPAHADVKVVPIAKIEGWDR